MKVRVGYKVPITKFQLIAHSIMSCFLIVSSHYLFLDTEVPMIVPISFLCNNRVSLCCQMAFHSQYKVFAARA